MSIRNIVNPTRVNKTLAEWAMDATVYSENKILVSEDLFYSGTNQPRYKLANGVDTWADLDYVPAGGADTNMANDDLILDDDRTHDAAGFSWSLRDLRQLNFESTSTPSGQPAIRFEYNPGAATFDDRAFMITVDGNTTTPAFDVRGNKNAAFGDVAQSNSRLRVYYNVAGGIGLNVYTDQPSMRAMTFQADGANSYGVSGQASGSGGIAGLFSGEFLGAIIQSLSPSGHAARLLGGVLMANQGFSGTQNDATLLHLRTTDLAALMIDPITKAQRDAIPPSVGMIIFMQYFDEDEPEGLYLYKTVGGWRLILTDV